MNRLKSKLIETYRLSTIPFRVWKMQRRFQHGDVPIFVVFYHRIADTHPNPWTMTCAEFERQIDWMQSNFELVDLQECQRRIQSGFNDRPTLSITFDDGYAENGEFALPMLIERRIPVTYFVTLENTIGQKPFQHDLDLGQPLPTHSLESLRALDMAGVEIGAHTRTHPDLGKITDPDQLVDEVITASRELERLIGRKVRYFAFPYGQPENLTAVAFQLLKREGFLGACTTLGGWNEIGGDPFQISRIHGDASFERMVNWLTFDPRLAKRPRFDYSDDTIALPEVEPAATVSHAPPLASSGEDDFFPGPGTSVASPTPF